MTLDEFAVLAIAPANAWYLSGTILTLGAVGFVNFRWKIAPLLAEARRATALVDALADSTALGANLPDLDTKIGSGAMLGAPWREFRATLVLPEAGEPPHLLATRDPATVFSPGGLLAGHLNLRFYHSLPNLLVGMGILGTFLGLLFGLHVASKGLATPDIAVARGALQGLLASAALKFSTSVAGLLASLLFSWREKHWTHRFDRTIGDFTGALEARLTRVTSEAIALATLRATHRHESWLARQEAKIENFPERVGAALAAQLTPQFTALIRHFDTRDAALVQPLERLSGEFSRTLSSAAGAEMARLATTLERVGAALEVHTAGLRDSSTATARELSASFREGGESLKHDVAETLSAILARLSVAIEEMTGRLNHAGAAAAHNLSHAVGGMENTAATFSRFGSEAERLFADLREAQTGFALAAAPVAEAAAAFRHSATRVENLTAQIQHVSDGLQKTLAELLRFQTQAFKQWQEYEERFSNLDAALANTFHELEAGLERTTILVKNWVAGLDQHTVTIVHELAAATSELRETVAGLSAILLESTPSRVSSPEG